MSEAPDTVPSTFNETLTLSTDQTAAARAQGVALGLDEGEFDRAASGAPQVPAESSAPSQEPDTLAGLKQPSLSLQEAEAMAEELIRAGMPEDQVRAALEADGYTPTKDPRTEEQLEFDRSFGGAKPEAYKLDFKGRAGGMDMAQIGEANTQITTWLSDVGFPPEIGPAVAERAIDIGQWFAKSSETQRELWAREEQANFYRMAGSDERGKELLNFAIDALARGGKGFFEVLAKSGALCDAGTIMHLANQGERLAARGAK
jgi:hypothetical protein